MVIFLPSVVAPLFADLALSTSGMYATYFAWKPFTSNLPALVMLLTIFCYF